MVRIIVVAALFASQAGAQVQSGNDLYAACTSENEIQLGFCYGYQIGVWEGIKIGGVMIALPIVDGANLAEVEGKVSEIMRICLPAEVEMRQMLDVSLAYLANNPADRHETARGLIIDAFQEAFPCS